MKYFLDFLSMVIFYVLYKIYNIYTATISLIISTTIIVIFNWLYFRKIEKDVLITFFLVVILGGLTIFLHKDHFIKWKVTITYLIFSSAFLISQCFMKKTLIQHLIGRSLFLPKRIYLKLNLAWGIFFFLCGTLNAYIAFYFSQSDWVNFKVFGLTLITLIFSLINGIYIYLNRLKNGN